MSHTDPPAHRTSRDRILRAAQVRFAEAGFAGTTIRAVAADADIDPAMVMRHFRNKQGLFAAATEVDLDLGARAAVPRDQLGRVLAARFLDVWESDSTGPGLRVLLATAASGEGRARIVEVFSEQLLPSLADGATDGPARTAMIASQLLGFALTRYVLELSPIAELSSAEAAEWLAPLVQSIIDLQPGRPSTSDRSAAS